MRISVKAFIRSARAVMLLGLFVAAPVHAVLIDLTLTESDFGFPSAFPTIDPGAIWTGTLEVGSHSPTPGADFLIDAFQVTVGDQSGADLDFNTGSTTVNGTAQVRNDGSGTPDFMAEPSGGIIAGFPHSFEWAIPVNLSLPQAQTGHLLTFNNIGIGDTTGVWILASFEFDGVIHPAQQLRFGTYELSLAAIPEPSTAVLLGSGLAGLAASGRRRSFR